MTSIHNGLVSKMVHRYKFTPLNFKILMYEIFLIPNWKCVFPEIKYTHEISIELFVLIILLGTAHLFVCLFIKGLGTKY
jgi:hypothetical protein